MNWLLIIVALVLIWRIAEGVERGMVKEVISFVSLVVLCLVVALIGTAVSKYLDKDIISVIVAIILLLIVCIVHRLLGVVFFSAKLIAKLPVIKKLDKILGAVFGVLETLVLLWMLFSVIMMFDTGMFGAQIGQYVADSKILSFIYKYNYLQVLVDYLAGKLQIGIISL